MLLYRDSYTLDDTVGLPTLLSEAIVDRDLGHLFGKQLAITFSSHDYFARPGIMLSTTNQKIGFRHLPGFSLAFDNPGEKRLSHMGKGGHLLKVNSPVGDDPCPDLYAGLQNRFKGNRAAGTSPFQLLIFLFARVFIPCNGLGRTE